MNYSELEVVVPSGRVTVIIMQFMCRKEDVILMII